MLVEFVKTAFVDLASDSMMVPWIYICFNHIFADGPLSTEPPAGQDNQDEAGVGGEGAGTSGQNKQSFNSSKVGGGAGLGTSTNINKSNGGIIGPNDANQYNSNINESGLDIENEYGYATDEDSVF